MTTLQIKNIPDSIVDELRDRAKHFNRDLESEAAAVLMQAITTDMWRKGMSADDLLERARRVREGHPDAWMTEEFLHMAKNDGRP